MKAPKYLQRERGGDLDDLKASIRKHGQLQPIVVDKATGQVLIGERRRQAIAAMRLEPDIVEVDTEDAAEALAIRLSEEITKHDIPLIEKAEAVKQFVDLLTVERNGQDPNGHGGLRYAKDGLGSTEAAARLGISEGLARELLRIAGLSTETKQAVTDGTVLQTVMRDISSTSFTKDQKARLIKKVAAGKMPNSQKGIREVLAYAKDPATPESVRKAILDGPESFAEAKRMHERINDRKKREEKKKDEAVPFSWRVLPLIKKLRAWAIDLASLRNLAGEVPPGQDRESLADAFDQLADQCKAWSHDLRLKRGPELPTPAQKRKVLEKIGDEWREVYIPKP